LLLAFSLTSLLLLVVVAVVRLVAVAVLVVIENLLLKRWLLEVLIP
jgi:hypothetical protein